MALTATLLTPAVVDKIDAHYPALVAGANAAMKCSLTAAAIPDLKWLRYCITESPTPAHEVIIFTDKDGLAGLVVVHLADLRISWECVNSQHPLGFGPIAAEMITYCKGRYGVAWGNVDNPAVRAAMLAATPLLTEDGITLRWGN